MQSPKPSCEATTAVLEQALAAGSLHRPPASVVEHLASCAHCQGRLAAAIGALAEAEGAAIDCEACQAGLAALSAQEPADWAGAIAAYPLVWRHLWSCPACLDDYLTALERAPGAQAGTLREAGLPGQAIAAIRRITVPRSVLALALPPPRLSASPLRGHGDNEFVIFEDGGYDPQAHLTVTVRDSGDGTWELTVTTHPPVVGRLRLSAGTTRLVSEFRGDGSATIHQIPFALLGDEAAPDLELIIVPVHAAPDG